MFSIWNIINYHYFRYFCYYAFFPSYIYCIVIDNNQIKFIVAQQGLATQTPLFLEEQIEAVVKSDKKPWYANLFLPTLFCVSLTVVCQVWLYITWKILLI